VQNCAAEQTLTFWLLRGAQQPETHCALAVHSEAHVEVPEPPDEALVATTHTWLTPLSRQQSSLVVHAVPGWAHVFEQKPRPEHELRDGSFANGAQQPDAH
jgi:hypothetical protein